MPDISSRLPPFVRDFMKEFKDDDLPGLAAELAFRFFLSLFPLVLVIVTLGAYISRWVGIDDPSGEIIDAIGDSLPSDASSVLASQIDGVISGANIGLLSIGLATAAWSASGGTTALMKAINRVYDLPETRPAPLKIGISLGLVLFGGLGLILAVSTMITTQAFAGSIASGIGMGREFGWIVQVARLPLVVFFVAVAVEFVYWIAPNRWTRPRLASPGALFFAVGWAAFTVGFAYYVSNFGSYNATYGAIAGVVIMLLWFQVSSLLILVGAEINSVLQARKIAAAALPPVTPARAAGFDAPAFTVRQQTAPVFEFALFAGAFIALIAWLRARPTD